MAKIRRSLNIEFPDELGALLTAVGNHETLLATSDVYREIYESQCRTGEEVDA